MKTFAPSALVGVVGAAILSGSVLHGSRPLAAGQAMPQAVRDRVPAATPYVLDRGTNRVFVVQHTIPDVVEFVWSPDGQSAAYTTGTYERFERPTSTGVWTLSIPSGTPQRVKVDGDYLFWARFDGALYIWDWRPDVRKMVVLRYDPVSRALMETSHRSIYFSPSGHYYHNFGGNYEGPFDVFVTADDRSLKASSALLRGLTSIGAPLGLAPERDLLLIPAYDKSFAMTGLLYDPSTDTARVVAGAGLMGWSTEPGELAYWQDGRVASKRIADVIVK